MADFNLNLLNYESHPETDDFLNIMSANFIFSFILQPTRITDRSATLIDNIYAIVYAHNAISGNLPQFLVTENLKIDYKTIHSYKYDYSKFNSKTFLKNFSCLNWSDYLTKNLDANEKFNVFRDKLSLYVGQYLQYHIKNYQKKKSNFLLSLALQKIFRKKFDT
mgnify:CR=1 FL=1